MTVVEARQLILDPMSPMIDRIEAAAALSLAPDATIEDLVECLRCRGVIASLAAPGLYRKTGRPRPRKLRDQADLDQWEQYLIKRRLSETADGAA